MSVTAMIFCSTCQETGPGIGDCGAVGFPSLKDTPNTVTGDYQTFGYIKKGFDAIGYRPWELEAITAFLQAHKRHKLSLYLEGQDVRYDSWDEDAPALDYGPEVTEFEFEDDDFVEGLFEVACDKCGVSVRTGTERLRPFEPFTLKPLAIRTFMTRVRNADGSNFHRVSSLLDYHGEQEQLANFLTAHGSHGPEVRIVKGDSAHAKPGHALPWTLAWHKPDPFRDDREAMVAADRLFVISEPWMSGDSEAPKVLHCYNLDGDELWRRDLRDGVFRRPEFTSEGVVVQSYQTDPRSYALLCFDPDSGAPSSRPVQHSLVAWFPDRRAFLGLRHLSDPDRSLVAAVEWPSLRLRWEWPGPGVELTDLSWQRMFATDHAVLFAGGSGHAGRPAWARCLDAATGRERWTVSLAEFGDFRGAHQLVVWRDCLLVSIYPNLFALDLADGRLAWQMEAKFFNLHESHDLLFGIDFGNFVAVDLRERKLRFAAPKKQFGTPPSWQLGTGCPIVDGEEILAVDQRSRTLWGLDGKSGRPVWRHRPSAGVTGHCPVVSGDRLLIQGMTGLCCYVRTAGS